MRTAFVQAMIDEARDNRDIHMLTADLGFEVFEEFSQQFPSQFTNVGLAEANMITMAGGMASVGLTPICYSIIPFLTYRSLEQIRNDICYPNLNVKIVGVGTGLSYGLNGPSHIPYEDLSVMRPLPNLTILSPSDPLETYQATREMFKIKGPVYLRIGKKGEKVLSFDTIGKFSVNKVNVIKTGSDLLIFTTGSILEVVLEAVTKIKGVNPTLVSIHTIKPLDEKTIINLIKDHQRIVTIEEHTVIGGLGSAIAEINSQYSQKPQLIIGLPEKYLNIGGSTKFLRDLTGFNSDSIVQKILKWLNKRSQQ